MNYEKISFALSKIWFEPTCFQVLWQFGIFSASPFVLPARPFRAAPSPARGGFRSSHFFNEPPHGIFGFFKFFPAPFFFPPPPHAGGAKGGGRSEFRSSYF